MTQSHRQQRIHFLTKTLAWVFLALALLHPLIVISTTAYLSDMAIAGAILGPNALQPHLTPPLRILIVLLSAIPALLLSAGFYQLHRTLMFMQTEGVFAASAFKGLRAFATALLCATIAKILLTPITGVLITLNQPEKSLVLSLDFGDVQTLVLCLSLWLLAWIMAEGHAVAQENAEIV